MASQSDSSVPLRIGGIIFFMAALSVFLEMISRTIASWVFFISSPGLGWGLFYVLTAFLFASFFFLALFSCGTAALFAGTGGYTQSVWNCGVYALFCVSLFATLLLVTGITEDDVAIFYMSVISIVALLAYNALVFVCLRKDGSFYWKNLVPADANTRLCLKVYALMIVVLEVACFLYANKLLDE